MFTLKNISFRFNILLFNPSPTAQSFLNYAFLCLIFTSWLALKPADRGLIYVLKNRGWKYFALAAIDVEANYLVVKAFQYTSLTSIQVSLHEVYIFIRTVRLHLFVTFR